jgi:hypothetical protein
VERASAETIYDSVQNRFAGFCVEVVRIKGESTNQDPLDDGYGKISSWFFSGVA